MAAPHRQSVWITRAQPGADATAERVRSLGHEPMVSPLLAVSHLDDVICDLTDVVALAFTSANGVVAFARLNADRTRKVFAVGQATAQAARAAGFRNVLSTDGNVDALVAGVAARRHELKGVVLHPGAAELSGDLSGDLTARGVQARHLVVYETTPVKLDEAQIRRLAACDAVLIHSVRAAQGLAAVLKLAPAPDLRALGLSKAVLRPLARTPLAQKIAPPFPLEAALLNLLNQGS